MTAPWWESQLDSIGAELRATLGHRYPGLSQSHADIVADTLASLIKELKQRPADYPPEWLGTTAPAAEGTRQHLHKLAQTILRRRVADRFRKEVREWATHADMEALRSSLPEEPWDQMDRRLTALRMLQICAALIAELPDEDRELVGRMSGATDRPWPLSDAERQRIRRIRQRLRAEIQDKLGDSVAALLKED